MSEEKKELKEYQRNYREAKKIVLSNKAPYGEEGAYKYYIGYVGRTCFRPLHIII